MTFVNILKSRLIFNNSTVSQCLLTNVSHISRAHISKSKSCFNEKSSTYFFQLRTKILTDFQICISVPLTKQSQPRMLFYLFEYFLGKTNLPA